MPGEFDGLVAVVTGGGVRHRRGDRRELLARGARVAVFDLDPSTCPRTSSGSGPT